MYEKYQALLEKNNETSYQVAKKTGISQTAFSNWKAGRSEPSVDSLKKLADHFGVPMEYFLEGKKEKEPTLNDIRKANGLKPIPEGDVILTKA